MSNEHDATARRKQLEALHSKTRIVRIAEQRGEFDCLEDGFQYYFPCGGGAISAYELRELADELDRRNKPHEDAINAFFEAAANNPDSFLHKEPELF